MEYKISELNDHQFSTLKPKCLCICVFVSVCMTIFVRIHDYTTIRATRTRHIITRREKKMER